MKTGFKDNTAVKGERPKMATEKQNDYIWNYKCPPYDQRNSCFVNAGTHFGVGHRTPVGSFEASSITDGPIPFGRRATMEVEEIG